MTLLKLATKISWLNKEPLSKITVRKTRKMLKHIISKIFGLRISKNRHRKIDGQLSPYLLRDIGEIERDINNKSKAGEQKLVKISYGQLWL